MQGATLTKRVPALQVLTTQRNFTLLWAGQFISLLGDGVFRVAMRLRGAAVDRFCVGDGDGLRLVPGPVAALSALWRGCRRPSPPACEHVVVRYWHAVAVAVIAALSLLHILQFWHLLTLSLLFGLADSFFQPVYMAVVPQLMDKRDHLQPANSLVQFGNLVSRVVNPRSARSLWRAGQGWWVLLASMPSPSCSRAGCLLLLREGVATAAAKETPDASSGAWRGIFADIHEGMRFVAGIPWLWITIAIAAASNITYSVPFVSVLPKLVSLQYGAGP